MPRYFAVEVERTVTSRRRVYVRVEDTAERQADLKRNPTLYEDEAKDVANDNALLAHLTKWEPHGKPEYRVVSSGEIQSTPNVDVIV
jgi:hypothetical protein